jgi:acetyltransferase
MDGKQAMQFKASLSDESIKSRFLGYIPEVSDTLIKHLVEIDYKTEMAIIAEINEGKKKQVIGIGRIAKDAELDNAAELAVIISDKFQGKNLGNILTAYMIQIAKELGYSSLLAFTFNHNIRMLNILKHFNFKLSKEDFTLMKGLLKL